MGSEPYPPEGMEWYDEGGARFLVPRERNVRGPGSHGPGLFFNEAMRLHRDLTVLFLRVWIGSRGRPVCALDGLAGCGARGLRILAEVPRCEVVFNDADPRAARVIASSASAAGISPEVRSHRLQSTVYDGRFDYVDVDPFGTPAPFADAALQAVRNRGVVALSATDTATLFGVHPRTCLRRYGSPSVRGPWGHELGLRILLGWAARLAASHDRGIEPLLSYAHGHALRAYLRVTDGAARADRALDHLGSIVISGPCAWRVLPGGWGPPPSAGGSDPGGRTRGVAAPVWVGPTVEGGVARGMVEEEGRCVKGRWKPDGRRATLLARLAGEAELPPLFFDLDLMASAHGIQTPSVDAVVGSLRRSGYAAGRAHARSKGVKTDASEEVVAEAMRDVASTPRGWG